MKIMFIGQTGILSPQSSQKAQFDPLSLVDRVETLSQAYAKAGNDVIVTVAKPYLATHIRDFNGVELLHKTSLDPNIPGGWLYQFNCALSVMRQQPDVVHMHGWQAPAFAPLMALLSPETSYIWTIDEVKTNPFIINFASKAIDHIISPTQTIKYKLRALYNMNTKYIPDGYQESEIPATPVKLHGLKKGQYNLTTAQNVADIRLVAKAYKEANTAKKMVILSQKNGPKSRLARQYPFLQFINVPLHSRQGQSLIEQAAVVITPQKDLSTTTVLNIMKNKTPLIIVTAPQYQEVVGIGGHYFASGDQGSLLEALEGALKNIPLRRIKAKQSQKRAENHFPLERTLQQYSLLYRRVETKKVPLDSLSLGYNTN